MSKLTEYQNTDVLEQAPHDLEESQALEGSKWVAASKSVTAVAGSIALASGVFLGNAFGLPGVVQAGQLLNPNSPDAAYAEDATGAGAGTNGNGAIGSAGSGQNGSLANGLSSSGFRKVKLATGAVVTIATTEPVPVGATVVSEPVITDNNGKVVTTPVLALPPLPDFNAGNTSSATPAGSTVSNPGTGTGSGNTSSATPSGGTVSNPGAGSGSNNTSTATPSSGTSGSKSGHKEDHEDEHEDHEDDD